MRGDSFDAVRALAVAMMRGLNVGPSPVVVNEWRFFDPPRRPLAGQKSVPPKSERWRTCPKGRPPHQGPGEAARRRRQIEAARLRAENGLVTS